MLPELPWLLRRKEILCAVLEKVWTQIKHPQHSQLQWAILRAISKVWAEINAPNAAWTAQEEQEILPVLFSGKFGHKWNTPSTPLSVLGAMGDSLCHFWESLDTN